MALACYGTKFAHPTPEELAWRAQSVRLPRGPFEVQGAGV